MRRSGPTVTKNKGTNAGIGYNNGSYVVATPAHGLFVEGVIRLIKFSLLIDTGATELIHCLV